MSGKINKFDGYEKIKTVGKGAFGTATLYRRINDNKHVVMKEIYISDMDNAEKLTALNEVKIISKLNHPNIIKYIGNFENEGSLVIIMEYANGGNLAQLIGVKRNRNEMFTESGILHIFYQICCGLEYMHRSKILHRDLKTANIFLNLDGTIKIGDFGISKVLNTRSQAQTVVGTPYYLSPEMCEGSDYNEKSDIWAIGCILYELATLRKPFEASTLPVLVQKIIACDFEDIAPVYSEDLSQIIKLIIQKNAEDRPTATSLKEIVSPLVDQNTLDQNIWTKEIKKQRSVVYEIDGFGDNKTITPVELPHTEIIDISVSATHCLIVTCDSLVYAWGEDTHGQLGLGDLSRHRKYPICINHLRGKHIVKCAAGNNFSLFLSKNGIIYSCGDGSYGCLGHGDWNPHIFPSIINTLISINITQIACGEFHAVALSSEGKLYTWGSSENGETGQGNKGFSCQPLEVSFPSSFKIAQIRCGPNATALLLDDGKILVCGSNKYNKLGLQNQDIITTFILLGNIKYKVLEVALGVNHTMLLTEEKFLISMGRNSEGQLGKGSTKNYNKPQLLRNNFKFKELVCGPTFTVATDFQNVIWFWGSYVQNNNLDNDSSNVVGKNKLSPLLNNTFANKNHIVDLKNANTEYVKEWRSVLALFSSDSSIKAGNILYLSTIKAKENGCYLTVHTTAVPPMKIANSGTHSSTFGVALESKVQEKSKIKYNNNVNYNT